MLLFNDTMYRPVYSHIYISKHLMLLFNFAQDETDDVIVIFQNISCYCLTTLRTAFSVSPFPFQNISCYCLTNACETIRDRALIFQNISCYCLTIFKHVFKAKKKFQNISCYCLTSI